MTITGVDSNAEHERATPVGSSWITAITHESGAISWTQITAHLQITYTIGVNIITIH